MKSFLSPALLALCLALSVGVAGPALSSPGGDNGGSLSINCGQARATIQCAAKSKNCTQTTLSLTSPDGRIVNLAKPRGMKDYTAVGLGCTEAKDGTPYLVAQYGELPEGCKFCEWFHIYSMKGELLTHSEPPVLTDDTLPKGNNQLANNKEFNAFFKLTITAPDKVPRRHGNCHRWEWLWGSVTG